MKLSLLKGLLLLVMFSSCCKGDSIETDRYELTPVERKLIPYKKGIQVSFRHSKGYIFQMEAVSDETVWNESRNFCEWHCCDQDFISYQTKNTVLQSEYPILSISLNLGGGSYYYEGSKSLDISVNYKYRLSFPYDSLGQFICSEQSEVICHDSIKIADDYYYKVLEKQFKHNINAQDSVLIVPKAILYSAQKGLLELKMTNDETYAIYN